MVLYIENPKDTIRKLLQLINGFGKVAGYKINIQKSLVFIYTNNEKSKRGIKEKTTFTITTNSINYLRISSVQFSRSVVSDSLQPHDLPHARPPCPSPTPGVHANS